MRTGPREVRTTVDKKAVGIPRLGVGWRRRVSRVSRRWKSKRQRATKGRREEQKGVCRAVAEEISAAQRSDESTFLVWRWRAPLRPLTLTLTRQNPNPLW